LQHPKHPPPSPPILPSYVYVHHRPPHTPSTFIYPPPSSTSTSTLSPGYRTCRVTVEAVEKWMESKNEWL
ncbi:hypothetical protein Pcinc_019832, partial [Petrolisthes cinctipes]